LFIEASVLKEWGPFVPETKEIGERFYPDIIIQCCLLIKVDYRLCYRQSVGFLTSLL
jgi:hypothetical protein